MMRMRATMPPAANERGFTLLEALITIVVVSIGLLGILGLQTVSIANTQISAARSTAAVAAESIAARILANPEGAAGYEDISHPAAGGNAPETDCIDEACSPADLATYDAWMWDHMLGERLPKGAGYVDCVDSGPSACRTYRVIVAWSERDRTGSGGTSDQCDATDIAISKRCFVTLVRP